MRGCRMIRAPSYQRDTVLLERRADRGRRVDHGSAAVMGSGEEEVSVKGEAWRQANAPPVTAWQWEVLEELRAIRALLAAVCESPAWRGPGAVTQEAVGAREPATQEVSEATEALPTWVLTDRQVAHLEAAIEAEQRVRGGAYGG